jgi:hypothetical protein
MKDSIFSYSFFGVRFGCWSIRPTTASVIGYDFKDVTAKKRESKTLPIHEINSTNNGDKILIENPCHTNIFSLYLKNYKPFNRHSNTDK